jgi:Family of unknown function (DUF6188)
MYGLPPDFDATPFVGRTLTVVSFSANTVGLTFDGDVAITVLGSYSQTEAGGVGRDQVIHIPVTQSQLMRLAGSSVVAARGAADGSLELLFDNGQAVTVYDDMPHYEAYHVRIGSRLIVV